MPSQRYIPEQITPTGLDDYLEIMTIAVFQAGVSWALVHKKWDAFRTAFANFKVERVAKFDQSDIERLSQDKSILRSERKIRGTIKNAQTMLALSDEFGSFENYLHSKKSYEELSADLRKRFQYCGELSVYYLLFRVRQPVPPFEHWITTIEGDHPRMAEMVELAKSKAQH